MLKDNGVFLRAITLSLVIAIQVFAILYIFVPKYELRLHRTKTYTYNGNTTTNYYYKTIETNKRCYECD